MKHTRNQMSSILALTLMLTMTLSIIILPNAGAHQPPINIPTWVYATVSPNPVGVNQATTLAFWTTSAPPDAMATNNVRWTFTVSVIDPNNKTTSLGNFISDTTGKATASFTPNSVGNWSLIVKFPQTVYNWSGSSTQLLYTNDVFLASSYSTSFIVQSSPVATPPLPPEYINQYKSDWFQVTSNWLGSGSPQIYGYMPGYAQVTGMIQPMLADNTTGSLTPHIMWTKPLENGGLVGGTNVGLPGDTFYMGLAYQERFFNIFIVDGKLYYKSPLGETGQSSNYNIIDLRNGKTLAASSVATLNAGYSFNGVTVLFGSANFGSPYDPNTLRSAGWSLSGVPSGSAVMDKSGNTLRVMITNVGTTGNPVYNVLEWNASKVIVPGISGAVAAGGSDKYDFNKTITYQDTPVRTSFGTIVGVYPGDCVITTNMSTASGGVSAIDSYYFDAISLKPATLGQLTFNQTYPALNTIIPGTVIGLCGIDPLNHIIMVYDCNTLQYMGYNYVTGATWGPNDAHESSFDYYAYAPGYFTNAWNCFSVFNGHLYESSYGGILYCYDTKDGSTTWTYGNGGPGNSTSSGFYTVYGAYPMFICGFTPQNGGVIYTFVSEHSPNTPLYKGSMIRCLNATSGAEIWKLPCFSGLFGISGSEFMLANGFCVYLNCYDQQIYAVAKGPSETTLTTSTTTVTPGGKVLLQGTVMDAAAGTNQTDLVARFPDGVPCVSDDNMSTWMEYVYMHHEPRPDVKGVEVALSAIGPDGSVQNIGTTTTDSKGCFAYPWTPPNSGTYTVVAGFGGTNAYYSSSAQTTVTAASGVPPTTTPTPAAPAINNTYILDTGIVLMLIIAVIGAVILMMIHRMKGGKTI